MRTVSIRELRNHGGQVLERVAAGEHLTITRSGRPVAELRPVQPATLSSHVILERRQHLPSLDPAQLKADLDELIDPSL